MVPNRYAVLDCKHRVSVPRLVVQPNIECQLDIVYQCMLLATAHHATLMYGFV
jgi:hypothetical protein